MFESFDPVDELADPSGEFQTLLAAGSPVINTVNENIDKVENGEQADLADNSLTSCTDFNDLGCL